MMQIDSNVIARAKRVKLLVQFGVGLEGKDSDQQLHGCDEKIRVSNHWKVSQENPCCIVLRT